MRFRALGSVQVWDGTSWSNIKAPQQRVVLAVLLARPGRVVSTERLVDEIWPHKPPRAAVNTVQTYVLRLRRMVDDEGMLITKGQGYQLLVSRDDIDIQVFERLVSSGKEAIRQGRLAAGVELLSAALALWRGPAMADVPDSPAVAAEAARLELHRIAAFEDLAEARLNLGGHADVVDTLQRLVDEHPFRERLRGQLMLALYRCGRRVDAMEQYREGRRLMRGELGLDPGPLLSWLESAIREDDPGLRLPTPVGALPPATAGPRAAAPPLAGAAPMAGPPRTAGAAPMAGPPRMAGVARTAGAAPLAGAPRNTKPRLPQNVAPPPPRNTTPRPPANNPAPPPRNPAPRPTTKAARSNERAA
jgi:DNA-binding SARP family transcriptional activator